MIDAWRSDGGPSWRRPTAASAAIRCSWPARPGAPIPDAGLRELGARLVPCDDLGSPGDVDTPADLPERLR